MTTPSDDNPFRTPAFAAAPPPPGGAPIPHWFTVKVRIVLAVCVVAALGLGALGAFGISRLASSGPPGVGDCLYLTHETGGKLAYHRVGCASDRATYQVENTYREDLSCSSSGYVRFKATTGSGAGRTLCLALNVRTGDCLRDVEDEVAIAKVSCADPTATERVEVLTHARDGEGCEGADQVLIYHGPPFRAVCLTPRGQSI